MTPDHLNVALIGATGKVAAPAHLNGLAAIPGAHLYAVCDIDATTIDLLADRLGAKAFTSFEEVLADPAVDAVDLVTPPYLHSGQTIAAARAGKAQGPRARLQSGNGGTRARRGWTRK